MTMHWPWHSARPGTGPAGRPVSGTVRDGIVRVEAQPLLYPWNRFSVTFMGTSGKMRTLRTDQAQPTARLPA